MDCRLGVQFHTIGFGGVLMLLLWMAIAVVILTVLFPRPRSGHVPNFVKLVLTLVFGIGVYYQTPHGTLRTVILIVMALGCRQSPC